MVKSFVSRSKQWGWFIQHPCLYPELMRRLMRKVRGPAEGLDLSLDVKKWCEQRSISTAEALTRITGVRAFTPVREKFREVFQQALGAMRTCPVPFISGAGEIDLLYWLCEHVQATKVVETGVALGWSSLAILLSITVRKGCLVSTDMPYFIDGYSTDDYVGTVVPQAYRKGWQIIPRADGDALPIALRKLEQADLCHYDSDKSYEGRIWTYPKLWGHLRSGGVFISDDIGDNLAFIDFADQIGVDPFIVRASVDIFVNAQPDKYVGILLKP